MGPRDKLDAIEVASPCSVRAAWERRPMAFAGALVVVFVIQLWAQAFGLRALAEFLRREPARPTPEEIDRAPVVHAPRPVRPDDADQPKRVPPRVE